jgi:predicted ATPase/DNA-binding winged helix-turn-helix (wHTH) protein
MDRIRVGAFEVFPGERLLCAAGKPVEVGARAFDLLLVLAESPGRLVTKATLIERVWPRVIVDENNLPAQIASLRRVLGAGAIRTVPRFGYRLDLPVSRPPAAPQAARHPAHPDAGGAVLPGHEGDTRLGPLVGRGLELAAIREALARERLVTLVGAAGVGKSRLAQEVLSLERDGPESAAAFVSLEPLESVEHVPTAVALALGLPQSEVGDRFQGLRHALQGASALLVLDGAEHFAASLAEPLRNLAAGVPGVRILVTSQMPLGRVGEALYRLGPLPIEEAVELFARRAAQADSRFELGAENAALAAEICRRLDGNPLAIELAAARVPAFGLAALLGHLEDRFRLLKLAGGADESRHGVLQAAFDWSYGLLTPAEQQVFDRLGAFPGSFTLDAAARCVADGATDVPAAIDLVGRLVDRSLVAVLPREPPRYTLLETARCYAAAHLQASGSLPEAERRVAVTELDVLDRAYEEYWSVDEAVWLHRHEPELDNVRAALDWARRHDPGVAVALHGSAWPLFVEADLHADARAAQADALALLSDALPQARLARFWEAVATCESERQVDRARYAAELAASHGAATGDLKSRYYALTLLALNTRDDLAAAGEALAAARRLEQPAWPSRLLAQGAIVEGALLTSAGKFAEARAAYRRALDHALATSERQALAATVHIVELDIACGAVAGALQLARPLAISLRYSGRRETRLELLVLLLDALVLAGELDEAWATAAELYELARRLDSGRLYPALDAMALLAARAGNDALAAQVAAAAEAAHGRHGEARRHPAAGRIRDALHSHLDGRLGAGWRSRTAPESRPLGEEEACAMALGLRA